MLTPSTTPYAIAPPQRRLHLHVEELGDGEVEVLDGRVVLAGLVVEEQLS